MFGKNEIFPTKSFLENATVVEMTSWILLSLWKLPNCWGNDAIDICSSRSSSTYKPLADRPNKVPRAYLSWCKWIDWSYVPFSHSIGDGVSIGQVFMCHDVFCKSSSLLGRWSRTSQWKAGPRDDSHKVTFWDICLCDVINGDEDFFCNTSSQWSITKTPIITSVLPPTESVVLHQNEGNARFVVQWGFLSSMASCQMMWSQYWHHTLFFFGERSDDVRWKHLCGEYLGMDVGIHYSTFSDKEAFMQQEHHYWAG